MEISKPSPPEERSILLSQTVCDALCQAINDYLYDIIYENTNPELRKKYFCVCGTFESFR